MSTASVPARRSARRRMLTPYFLVAPTVVLLAVFFLAIDDEVTLTFRPEDCLCLPGEASA